MADSVSVPDTLTPPQIRKQNGVTSQGVITLQLTAPSLYQGPVDAYQLVLVELVDGALQLKDLPPPENIFIENDYVSTISMLNNIFLFW